MSFGSSNAKIYAEKETGVTFKDVQGEDEAKEALTKREAKILSVIESKEISLLTISLMKD